MCIDATDPEKGNWLRYVNWACSGEEQNLFPLEINRAIYYKTLKVRVLELVSVTLHAFLYILSLAVTDSNNFADFERIMFESDSSTHWRSLFLNIKLPPLHVHKSTKVWKLC